MNRHIKRFKELIIDRPLEEIADTLEQDGPIQAMKKAVPLLVAGLVTVGLFALILVLLYTGLGALMKFIIPVT